MKTETNNETNTGAIPALRIPKLKFRFEVFHYLSASEAGRKDSVSVTLAEGIPTVEDAVRIAWAMVAGRPVGCMMIYAHFTAPGIRGRAMRRHRDKHLFGYVPCDYERRRQKSLECEIEEGRKSLKRLAEKFGADEQRFLWFERLGGYGSARGHALLASEPFRVALGRNNFAEAERLAGEIEAAAVEAGRAVAA